MENDAREMTELAPLQPQRLKVAATAIKRTGNFLPVSPRGRGYQAVICSRWPSGPGREHQGRGPAGRGNCEWRLHLEDIAESGVFGRAEDDAEIHCPPVHLQRFAGRRSLGRLVTHQLDADEQAWLLRTCLEREPDAGIETEEFDFTDPQPDCGTTSSTPPPCDRRSG
jgi:hypothetical protein